MTASGTWGASSARWVLCAARRHRGPRWRSPPIAPTRTIRTRVPEVNYGDTLEGDLSRRDFTVNAMALRVPDLQFVDPFGGASDLSKGVLRTPVDPRQSMTTIRCV